MVRARTSTPATATVSDDPALLVRSTTREDSGRRNCSARLTDARPGSRRTSIDANASAYNARLDELHSWTESQVEAVPEDRRLLVTSHDSLGYFANLYGFEVVGVILSITTEVEPSADEPGGVGRNDRKSTKSRRFSERRR